MTYGWAILIIAVVLTVLFSLGVFSGSSLTTSACVASPGFLCSNPIYLHSDANIVVTIGQETGIDWVGANFTFVPTGTPFVNGVPSISFNSDPSNTLLGTTGMASGGNQATLYLPANSTKFPVTIGTPISGSIWVQYYYTTSSGGITQYHGPAYVEIGALNLKAS
ncbi:MAG: hypothetical protein ACREBH_03900 [Candidatus Micrarchaeaceae archaeon]